MSIDTDGTVRDEALIDLPEEQTFRAVADLDRIKPREHNALSVSVAATVLEQRAGGDVYDRGIDGNICRWSRVLGEQQTRVRLVHRHIESHGPGWESVRNGVDAPDAAWRLHLVRCQALARGEEVSE